MDFKKFLPGQNKEENIEYFWSLIIEPGWIQTGIWRINQEEAQVVFSGLPFAWEIEEDLVTVADSALSVAVQNFPQEAKEPEKVVFGVTSSWVSGGEIKSEYLDKLKVLCSELSLKPVGFVIIPEAVSHLIKSEEGSSLNAVMLGIYKEVVELSVFRLGNLVGTTQVARSVSVVEDVSEGLARFANGTDPVPSRFIIYDGRESELEEERQSLLKANWEDSEKVKFLHAPKIEIVDPKRKVNAVSLAGASELAHVKGIYEQEPPNSFKEEEQDVIKVSPQEVEEIKNIAKPEDFGFQIDKDVSLEEKKNHIQTEEVESRAPEITTQIVSPRRQSIISNLKGKLSFLNKAKGILEKKRVVKEEVHVFSDKKEKNSTIGGVFVAGIVVFLLILVGVFLLWWLVPKATITIYVSPQKLEERLDVSLDPNVNSSSPEEKILKAKEVSTSSIGEKTKSATGTKTVGDKATGEVTLYRVGTELSLASGTTIYGPESLAFVLDNSVTIASGSASSPGTAKVLVKALDIGAQYNLASGTSFRVGNYSNSDIEAKNESSFSGGSSRQISAVSGDDQKSLLNDLTDELESKAKDSLKNELGENEFFVEESLVATTSSKIFSGKVGDEASTVKLSMTLDARALVINGRESLSLFQKYLSDKIPSGYILPSENIDFEFKANEGTEKPVVMSVILTARLLPSINPDDISKKVVGKYPSLAQEFLSKEVPGFVRVEITIKPSFPGRLKTLPRVQKNITVEISAER